MNEESCPEGHATVKFLMQIYGKEKDLPPVNCLGLKLVHEALDEVFSVSIVQTGKAVDPLIHGKSMVYLSGTAIVNAKYTAVEWARIIAHHIVEGEDDAEGESIRRCYDTVIEINMSGYVNAHFTYSKATDWVEDVVKVTVLADDTALEEARGYVEELNDILTHIGSEMYSKIDSSAGTEYLTTTETLGYLLSRMKKEIGIIEENK